MVYDLVQYRADDYMIGTLTSGDGLMDRYVVSLDINLFSINEIPFGITLSGNIHERTHTRARTHRHNERERDRLREREKMRERESEREREYERD